MKRMFSCSSSQVAVESWSKQDQKLLEAVEKGDVGRVAALAARKTARPTKLNALGQSAFHLAAAKGLTECLRLLLARGAHVNERNEDGSTALHLATIACQPQCVKVLLQHGANESHVDGQNRTPLHWAASSGCASSVLLLCDHEALLDVADAHGQTPLMLAARGNHVAICSQLLQRGADPNLADRDNRTALSLACEVGSVECAELLLSAGAAVGDTQRCPRATRTSRTCPENGARGARESRAGDSGGSQSDEDEEDEDEEQQEGCAVQRVRHLRERLARKTRECQRLAAAANGLRQRLRELVRLLPGDQATDGTEEDEDGACFALLAQELRERKALEEEEDGGHGMDGDAGMDGDDGMESDGGTQAAFLAWLQAECAGLRAAKASAFARSKGLRREVEEALRSKLHYEVVSADAVRRSLAAWEKLALGLEQALSRADRTHAEALERSRGLLAKLRRPASGGKSRAEAAEGESLEKEVVELKESNGRLLAELAGLGRERERLQDELRRLRAQDGGGVGDTEAVPEDSGAAALARARQEASRLRRRLSGQRRELAALRDRVGERAMGEAGDVVLRELHRKLDGLVRSQHEALQLVAEMEGDGPRGDGARGAGEPRDATGEAGEEVGMAAEPPTGIADGHQQPEAEAERWRAAAEQEKREKEAAEARAAEREQEVQELREKAEELERSAGSLQARLGELSRACRDKDSKLKKLLVETEKLSAEVLTLRSQSARLQLQLEVQQKNHRDVLGVYRTHLLNAAQGFMDQGVHALLLRILRTEE